MLAREVLGPTFQKADGDWCGQEHCGSHRSGVRTWGLAGGAAWWGACGGQKWAYGEGPRVQASLPYQLRCGHTATVLSPEAQFFHLLPPPVSVLVACELCVRGHPSAQPGQLSRAQHIFVDDCGKVANTRRGVACPVQVLPLAGPLASRAREITGLEVWPEDVVPNDNPCNIPLWGARVTCWLPEVISPGTSGYDLTGPLVCHQNFPHMAKPRKLRIASE